MQKKKKSTLLRKLGLFSESMIEDCRTPEAEAGRAALRQR